MAHTDAQYDAAIEYARKLGAEHGRNAATWYTIDSEDDARRVLAAIEDCDLLDGPRADLSGQYANTLTGPELVTEALYGSGVVAFDDDGPMPYETDEYDSWFTDLCDAYELAFDNAAEDEIARAARAQLA